MLHVHGGHTAIYFVERDAKVVKHLAHHVDVAVNFRGTRKALPCRGIVFLHHAEGIAEAGLGEIGVPVEVTTVLLRPLVQVTGDEPS